MLLLDIEKAVKPLSKEEKEQLIRDIQRLSHATNFDRFISAKH